MYDQTDLSTRDKILYMLKFKGELSAKEITDQLGITGMAVRRHISTLERDHLIESTTVRQPMGRPAAVYRLTKQAEDCFPKRYHTIALDLLSELEAVEGNESVNRLFELRQASLYKRYHEQMQGKSLQEKVATLSEIQNENGYMANWHPEGEGEYVLTEHNCPIFQVAGKYNHACSCELNLFASLLEADVERTDCLTEGGNRCVYRIRDKQNRDKQKTQAVQQGVVKT